jgi:hypothetical protein
MHPAGRKVLTSLEGRSAETKERARTAGMAAVSDDEMFHPRN